MNKINADPLTDWQGFYEELIKESPRAVVIIAGAFLDAQLRNLLAKYFVDDHRIVDQLLGTEDDSGKPLSSFGARIQTAYCLGLIGRQMHNDLMMIKNIRNKFAHKMHGHTFDDPKIVSWCKSIKFAKMITDAVPNLPSTPQNMFLMGATQLAGSIASKTEKIVRGNQRRSVPEEPWMSEAFKKIILNDTQ